MDWIEWDGDDKLTGYSGTEKVNSVVAGPQGAELKTRKEVKKMSNISLQVQCVCLPAI